MVIQWSLNDSKFPQVTKCILADLNSAMFGMVSILLLVIRISPVFFSPQFLRDSSKGTNYNWYNHHPHVPLFIFSSLARSKYLFIFLLSFIFPEHKIHLMAKFSFFFFFVIDTRSGLLVRIKWSVCISKSQIILCNSFSGINLLHSSQSCLVWESFCASLLNSLIMRLIVSSLFPHNLHLLFCCILLIFGLT